MTEIYQQYDISVTVRLLLQGAKLRQKKQGEEFTHTTGLSTTSKKGK
jgi:hypothetical protein